MPKWRMAAVLYIIIRKTSTPQNVLFQKILILQLYATYVHADNVQTCYIYIKHLNEKGKYKAKIYCIK